MPFGVVGRESEVEARPVDVVVADDSEPARRAIEAVVSRARQFQVAGTAASGEEAIELVARLRPGLALLDVRMPGMGGIAAAREIGLSWPETVLLLVSALPEEDLPLAVHSCGVAAVVHKPALTVRRLECFWRDFGAQSL